MPTKREHDADRKYFMRIVMVVVIAFLAMGWYLWKQP